MTPDAPLSAIIPALSCDLFAMCIRRLILCLALPSMSMAADLNVVPAVRSWSPAQGTLDASGIMIEVAPKHAAALQATAAVIREDLAALRSDRQPTGKPVTLLLTLDGADAARPES